MSDLRNKQNSFYELLDAIRARPGIYLGEASLFRLWLFIAGYLCALYQHQIADDTGNFSDIKFLLYIARHTDSQPVGCRSYHTMISQHVGGDTLAAMKSKLSKCSGNCWMNFAQ